MAELARLKGKYSVIGEIRGKGLMIGIELVRDKEKTPAQAEASAIRDFCCAEGLLLGVGGVYGNVLRIQPPLVISEEALERVVALLDEALGKLS